MRAEHYRHEAQRIIAMADVAESDEARRALVAVAQLYETLANQVDAIERYQRPPAPNAARQQKPDS